MTDTRRYDFDTPLPRRETDSLKWREYGADVLPLWVADMDFRSPEPVVSALVERMSQGIYGYAGQQTDALLDAFRAWLARRQGWQIPAESITLVPGLVTGMNIVVRALTQPGDGVAMLTPVYPPFLKTALGAGCTIDGARLAHARQGALLRYEIDFDALEAAITPRTRVFMLCNPHNPVGRVYTRAELERLADLCLRHDLWICSDEIHGDLILGDAPHIPMASLGPDVAARCVTLQAPSKTFNLAGLGCGFLIAESASLRARLSATREGIVPWVNLAGIAGAEAAYAHGEPWLEQVRTYLRGNRDAITRFVRESLPGVAVTEPEGTYLAWLDCAGLDVREHGTPFQFCLRQAKVALNDGASFGAGGEGFLRLNFGCPRSTLMEALERLGGAVVESA